MSIRWLDLIVALDRLGGMTGPPAPTVPELPAMRPFRAACLRSGVTDQELRSRLLEVTSHARAKALFERLGLGVSEAESWLTAWIWHGATGLAQLLPLSELARSAEGIEGQRAWRDRCAGFVQAQRADLQAALEAQAANLHVAEPLFRSIVEELAGTRLSRNDVEDLALFATIDEGLGDALVVDASRILALAQPSQER